MDIEYERNHDFMTEQNPALFKHPAIFVGPGGETIIECEGSPDGSDKGIFHRSPDVDCGHAAGWHVRP